MTAVETVAVTEPGVVYDMPESVYHSDPVPGGSLSSSGARKLLAPSCPALYKWERDHPPASKKTFDFGHAAHDAILGGGPEIVSVDHDDWRTKAAQSERDEIRARGAVPLLAHEYQQVQDMADALRLHPVASTLLSPDNGQAEASLFWTDERTGVNLRSRLDLLPNPGDDRMVLPDYKSSISADPEKFVKHVVDFGYHCQAAFYSDAVRALNLADDVAFVFVVQEKTAPYLISVVQPDITAMRIGELLNRRAIDTYERCTRTDVWPGYVDDVALVSLPFWYERNYEQGLSR